MSNNTPNFDRWILGLFAGLAIFCGSSLLTLAQQPAEPGQRGITTDGFAHEPVTSVLRNRRPGRSTQKGTYRTTASAGAAAKGKTDMAVGLTISRGRIATAAESGNENLAKVDGCIKREGKACVSRASMVLVRLPGDAAVSAGDQIQMTIEYLGSQDVTTGDKSNKAGFLYLIDREQFPNGTFGPAKLIFPTLNTYNGGNQVMPGKTVTMPDPKRAWTVSRSDAAAAQSYETYTIIVSPEPLTDLAGHDLELASRPITIDEKLLAGWISRWGGGEKRGDLEQGAGQLITQREINSSGSVSSGKRGMIDDVDDLNGDDPAPQITFDKVVSAGGAMLVVFRLPYTETAANPAPPAK